MLKAILKRRLTDDQIANLFVNVLMEAIDLSFDDIAHGINEDIAFETEPAIEAIGLGHFVFIVFAANVSLVQSTFDAAHAAQIERLIIQKIANIYEMPIEEAGRQLKDFQSFINRVNHPSKNLVYGMSKAIFAKYELHEFQDEYFKSLKAPNPLFIKRLNEVMENFLWDWDAFFAKYKI
jgi:hypothetical protein